MQTRLSAIALALSLGALAVGAFAAWRPGAAPGPGEARIDALAARLARLERVVADREPAAADA
ncbi:MAG: hypothetical protein ACC662_10655, partial [Planctomycetota bacterium]